MERLQKTDSASEIANNEEAKGRPGHLPGRSVIMVTSIGYSPLLIMDPKHLDLDPKAIRELCVRYERELIYAKDWMFWFLMVWTILLLGMEWLHFFTARGVPAAMTAGYVVLLGTYIAHKEVLRWTGIAAHIHRGEIFVYIWWG